MSVIADRTRTSIPEIPRFSPEPECERDDGEFLKGEFQEKIVGWESEWIAGVLLSFLNAYVRPRRLGWVVGSNASYQCYGEAFPEDPERYRKPDVSFIAHNRIGTMPKGHCTIVPDLAVEVISPNDSFAEIDVKIDEYLKVGVKLVWIVVPDTRALHIHRIDGSTQTLKGQDELSGESVVPGFKCVLADLFPPVDEDA